MSYRFEAGQKVYWVTKDESNEVVDSGEIIVRTDRINEAVNTPRQKPIQHVRYGIKASGLYDKPDSMDVYVRDGLLYMPESRLFSSKTEAHKNILEWQDSLDKNTAKE